MSAPRRRFRLDVLPVDPSWLPAEDPAYHYLTRVLRLETGARVRAFDGRGHEQVVELTTVNADQLLMTPVGEPRQARPHRAAHLVVALLKPKAMDIALRMAVEAGVTHLSIVGAERSIRRPPRLDRWSRLCSAAAQQCGRADLPELRAFDDLASALDALPEALPRFIALPDAAPLDPTDAPAAVLVGPEGGWTSGEVQAALRADARPLGLGAWVLRADTATALASGWLCQRGE